MLVGNPIFNRGKLTCAQYREFLISHKLLTCFQAHEVKNVLSVSSLVFGRQIRSASSTADCLHFAGVYFKRADHGKNGSIYARCGQRLRDLEYRGRS
jgi:hypothetical protein